MSDVFVSYARPDEGQAVRVADALRSAGYNVWRDDELPAHRAYADVIEERLKAAEAVVVLWSPEAAKSQWVRAEADAARSADKLVQATLDGSIPPMPFNQIQCADLNGWDGEADSPGWRKLTTSVAAIAGPADGSAAEARPARQKVSVCVLPFQNMSGDSEQEYFSDGISEDITTDLSKVSALDVIARNTAFQFKGQSVDVCDVAKKLGVSHVLEGSVRKAGARVRITAQLIDGKTGGHVWADRYDRDLTDIFAIQDEISKAIVDALKVKLLPQEQKAIQTRGTSNVEAYNVYLMARQLWISGFYGDVRNVEAIARISRQAVTLDPNYAEAWALMALAQAELRFWLGLDHDALPAAERALELNPDLPEALCVKARYLESEGRDEEAVELVERALSLDPDSWEVNREAARLMYREGRTRDAIPFFEKAMSLIPSDFHSGGMLTACYSHAGDREALQRVATPTLQRAEAALAKDPTNGAALAAGVAALLILREKDRAKEWIDRATLIDSENVAMLYNLGCAYVTLADDVDGALDMFEQFFERVRGATLLKHMQADPDLDRLRDHPRFKHMLAAARARIAAEDSATPTVATSAPPHS
ncbi:MAG TPA: TIR domain-containing protein [Sphingomicrobium sp.]